MSPVRGAGSTRYMPHAGHALLSSFMLYMYRDARIPGMYNHAVRMRRHTHAIAPGLQILSALPAAGEDCRFDFQRVWMVFAALLCAFASPCFDQTKRPAKKTSAPRPTPSAIPR